MGAHPCGSSVAERGDRRGGSLDVGKPTAVATDGTLGTVWPNWFTGKIDGVKIWPRPLATSEVTSVFKN